MIVGGEAGIGKSRLVDTFAEEACSGGALVLRGYCVELGGGGLPLGPLGEILGELAAEVGTTALAELLGPAAAGLARLVPGLGGGAGDAGSHSAAPVSQAHLFEVLLGVLARLGDRQPAVLVIEDLHWADPATWDLVRFWGRRLRRGRVVVVTTYRSDDLRRGHPLRAILAELGRAPHVERIELTGLTRAQLGELVAGILGAPANDTMIDDIAARCDGNPFFAEELVAGRSSPGQVPATLAEILLARVDRLSGAAREVVQVAAVVGRRANETLLGEATTGLVTGDLEQALGDAIAGGVLVLDPLADGVAFRHALMQEAVYGQLLPGRRRSLHRRVAEALSKGSFQARPAEGLAALAHHWHEAGDLPRALAASVKAAEASDHLHAHAAAYRHLERALELWERVPSHRPGEADRVDLMERAARAVFLGGLPIEKAVTLLDAALGEIDPGCEPIRAGLLEERLGFYQTAANRPEVGLGHYERAVDLVPDRPPAPARATVLRGYSRALYLSGRFEQAERVAREAVEVARLSGARDVEGDALNTLGVAVFEQGRLEGLALVEQALGIAAELGDGDYLLRAYTNLSDAFGEIGDWDRAAEVSLKGVDLARRLGLCAPWAMLAGNAAISLDRLGRSDDALALTRDESFLAGSPYQIIGLILLESAIEGRRGHTEAAERLLGEAERLVGGTSDPQMRGSVRISEAELALARDDPASALQAVEDGLALTAATGWNRYVVELCALGLRALADQTEGAGQETGRREMADRLLHQARAAVAAVEAGGGLVSEEKRAFVALAEAEHTRLTGSSEPRWWEHAAIAFHRSKRSQSEAYARLRLAEALLAGHGSRADTYSALRQSHELAIRLEAVPLVVRIEALARMARLSLATSDTQDQPAHSIVAGFTPREKEVASLLVAGCTDKEIANRLYISPKTASVHVSNVVRKLGVHNRFDAGRIAARLGVG